MGDLWIKGKPWNCGWTFEIKVTLWIISELWNYGWFFFTCEIGFVSMWNRICSNVKLDLFHRETEFAQVWNLICSKVKLDLSHCEMGFLQMRNGICFNVKLILFWIEIGFVLMWNGTKCCPYAGFFLQSFHKSCIFVESFFTTVV